MRHLLVVWLAFSGVRTAIARKSSVQSPASSTCPQILNNTCAPCNKSPCSILKEYTGTTDVELCCRECTELQACAFWTLNTRTKICHLKTMQTATSGSDACVSGVVRPPSPAPPPPPPPSPVPPKGPHRNVLLIVVDGTKPEL